MSKLQYSIKGKQSVLDGDTQRMPAMCHQNGLKVTQSGHATYVSHNHQQVYEKHL